MAGPIRVLLLLTAIVYVGAQTLPGSTLHTQSACYGATTESFFNINCTAHVPSSKIVVSRVTVGAKPISLNCPMALGENDTSTQECCQPNAQEDCIFDFTGGSVFNKGCTGMATCTLQVGRDDTSKAPCYNSSLFHTQTNFMTMEYYCIPDSKVHDLCGTTVDVVSTNGDVVYLSSNGYPAGLPSTFTSCTCSLETESCTSGIDVYTIDRRLQNATGTCQQTLRWTDGGVPRNLTCADNIDLVITQTSTSSNYLRLELSNSLPAQGGLLWMGFKDNNGTIDLRLKCPAEDQTFCTTTTTTPTTTTTVTTTTTTVTTTTATTTTTTITSTTTTQTTTTTETTTTATETTTTTPETTTTTTVTTTTLTTTTAEPTTTTLMITTIDILTNSSLPETTVTKGNNMTSLPPPSAAASKEDEVQLAIIVGASVAGVLGLAIVALATALCLQIRKDKRKGLDDKDDTGLDEHSNDIESPINTSRAEKRHSVGHVLNGYSDSKMKTFDGGNDSQHTSIPGIQAINTPRDYQPISEDLGKQRQPIRDQLRTNNKETGQSSFGENLAHAGTLQAPQAFYQTSFQDGRMTIDRQTSPVFPSDERPTASASAPDATTQRPTTSSSVDSSLPIPKKGHQPQPNFYLPIYAVSQYDDSLHPQGHGVKESPRRKKKEKKHSRHEVPTTTDDTDPGTFLEDGESPKYFPGVPPPSTSANFDTVDESRERKHRKKKKKKTDREQDIDATGGVDLRNDSGEQTLNGLPPMLGSNAPLDEDNQGERKKKKKKKKHHRRSAEEVQEWRDGHVVHEDEDGRQLYDEEPTTNGLPRFPGNKVYPAEGIVDGESRSDRKKRKKKKKHKDRKHEQREEIGAPAEAVTNFESLSQW